MSLPPRSPRYSFHAFPFFLPHVVPLFTVLTHYSSKEWHALIPPLFVWIVIPILDLILPSRTQQWCHPLTRAQKKHLDSLISFRLAVYLWPLTQFSLLFWVLHRISTGPVTSIRLIGLLSSLTLSAAEGINCAHELLHRRSKLERLLADALLSSVWYAHFSIEHARGHHFRVATPKDPATLRYGHSFYTFLPRTVFGGFLSACNLEARRLSKIGLPVVSIHNRIIQYAVVQIAIPIVLGFAFGPSAVATFFFQAITAVILLEQINAIEHYGLSRAQRPDGSYERVGPRHSWDAPHSISSYLLFKLQLHADHHLRRFQSNSSRIVELWVAHTRRRLLTIFLFLQLIIWRN